MDTDKTRQKQFSIHHIFIFKVKALSIIYYINKPIPNVIDTNLNLIVKAIISRNWICCPSKCRTSAHLYSHCHVKKWNSWKIHSKHYKTSQMMYLNNEKWYTKDTLLLKPQTHGTKSFNSWNNKEWIYATY